MDVTEEDVHEVMALMEGLTLGQKRKVVTRLQELVDSGQLDAYVTESGFKDHIELVALRVEARARGMSLARLISEQVAAKADSAVGGDG